MTMATATIGIPGTALSIGRIGFGGARLLGGHEMRASARLVEQALACGIRHFDTAPTYGNGQSEAVLGEVLQGVDGITITTKVGFERPSGAPDISPAHRLYRSIARPLLSRMPGVKVRLQHPEPVRSYSPDLSLDPAAVRRSLDESRRLLRRDPDILLVHEPGRFQLDEEAGQLFEELRREGRFQAFGTGTGDAATLPAFGRVRQARYPAAPGATPPGTIAVWHGVLRGATSSDMAARRLYEALVAAPQAAFLVSASAPHQLRSLFRGL